MFQTLQGALGAFVGQSVAGAAGRKNYDSNLSHQGLGRLIGASLQVLLVTASTVRIVMFQFREQFSEWLGLQPKWPVWAVVLSTAIGVIQLRFGQWQGRKKAIEYGVLQMSKSVDKVIPWNFRCFNSNDRLVV